MKKKIIIPILIAVIIVQLAIPIMLVREKYDILENGTEYKFRVNAYAVGKKIKFEVLDDYSVQSEDAKYGVIAVNANGFAQINSIISQKPTTDYITSKKDGYFQFPINYMRLNDRAYESLFHKIYERSSTVYIKVRVKDGKVVLENMFVDNMTITEYLETL